MATSGQVYWPRPGSYMAATGQDLMAADNRLGDQSERHQRSDLHPSVVRYVLSKRDGQVNAKAGELLER